MIYRNQNVPEDERDWTAIRNPTRAFVDELDKNENDVYIVQDRDGVTWAIFAMPLQVLDTDNGMM